MQYQVTVSLTLFTFPGNSSRSIFSPFVQEGLHDLPSVGSSTVHPLSFKIVSMSQGGNQLCQRTFQMMISRDEGKVASDRLEKTSVERLRTRKQTRSPARLARSVCSDGRDRRRLPVLGLTLFPSDSHRTCRSTYRGISRTNVLDVPLCEQIR